MSELEKAAREVYKYGQVAVNQIICLGGNELCQPCQNREKFALALDKLGTLLKAAEQPNAADEPTARP